MDKDKLKHVRELAYYMSIGFSIALSIFIGVFIGIYLDKYFGTHPWLMFIFMGFGIAAGFRNIGLAIKKSRKF